MQATDLQSIAALPTQLASRLYQSIHCLSAVVHGLQSEAELPVLDGLVYPIPLPTSLPEPHTLDAGGYALKPDPQ